MNIVHEDVNNHLNTAEIFIYIKKAFDMVDQQFLLDKMSILDKRSHFRNRYKQIKAGDACRGF